MNSNVPAVLGEVTKVIRSDDMQTKVRTFLPPNLNLDKFTEVMIEAISQKPEVLEADRDSLYRSCIAAARRGLLPDGKEGAFVIYSTNVGTKEKPRWLKMVNFLPMIAGIIKELAKAGIHAYAVSVYEKDQLSLWNDDNGQHVQHTYNVLNRGAMYATLASAKMPDGRTYVEAMSMEDVEQVARRSKQNYVDQKTGEVKFGGTWRSDFDRMAQKSAMHRLRKRLPILDEEARGNMQEEESETEVDPVISGAQEVPPAEVAQQALPAPTDNPLRDLNKPRRSRTVEGILAADKQPQEEVLNSQGEMSAEAPIGEDDIV